MSTTTVALDRRNKSKVLRLAFEMAIDDRRQFAADNQDCAPDFADEVKQEGEVFSSLLSRLPVESGKDTLFAAAKKMLDDYDAFDRVLYIAGLAAISIRDSIAVQAREAEANLAAFENLRKEFCEPNTEPGKVVEYPFGEVAGKQVN